MRNILGFVDENISLLLSILGLLFVGGFLVWLSYQTPPSVIEGQKRCKERFGEGWEYRSSRAPDMCVNKQGEGKYL